MGLISFIKDMFCTDTLESRFPEEYKPTYPDKERLRVIAKSISCNDAEYMYHSKEEQPGCCPVCYCKLQEIPNLNYRMRRRNDLYITYDGYFVVSQKFKYFCEERGYSGLIFVKLPKTNGFYFFTCEKQTLYLDEEWLRHTVEKQPCCGCYYEIGGPNKIIENIKDINTDDFIAKSHLSLESNRKSPIIIIGLSTMKAMQDYGLKGVYFDDVYELMD